jgi:hypothetical protein
VQADSSLAVTEFLYLGDAKVTDLDVVGVIHKQVEALQVLCSAINHCQLENIALMCIRGQSYSVNNRWGAHVQI